MKHLIFYTFLSFILLDISICSFQTSLFKEMNKNSIGKNLIISPISIYQALGLTANGAKGVTQKEMLLLLGNESVDELNQINYDILELLKDFSTVEIANAVMTRFTPTSEFTEISENYFAPTCELKSLEQVNGWCSEKTHGKIRKILDKLEDDVLMIILNAVYFKGKWSIPFKKDFTVERPFYNLANEENELLVDTMKILERYRYYENSKLQAIELNYENDSMSAVIILPSKETDINEFIESLDKEGSIKGILDKLYLSKVNLELPKFELEFFTSLKKDLKNMGMLNAFTNFADFSGIIEKGGMKIDDVLHKTYLKVDEEGTEAAAVTAVIGVKTTSLPRKETTYEMKVNRPFLFLLRNKKFPTNYDLLFMSKIEKIK